MSHIVIAEVSIDELKRFPTNARTHSRKQIRNIARSIKKFGFTNPILIDDENHIIAGHGRVEAARSLDMQALPTVKLSHLSEADKRAYVLADNKLALQAGWDRDILAIELQGLLDIGFDIELTGFETPEIDLIVDSYSEAHTTSGLEDRLPPEREAVVSRLGDCWKLGEHRLLCADSTDATSYQQLLGDQKASLVFTDPPYNVPIEGHVSGLGQMHHREFAMASGEMSDAEFTIFLKKFCEHAAASSRDGALQMICMDWRHVQQLLAVGEEVYDALLNIIVWNKSNGGMGSLYRSKHELICLFKVRTAPHTNNVELGRHGRNRSNVWNYAGVNTFRSDRMDELAMHPTVKPVALVADAIKDVTHRGEIVLDSFSGSGTSIIAAEKTGRRAFALEIDPHYVDVAIRRWESFTGKKAILSGTNQSFEEISEIRSNVRTSETLLETLIPSLTVGGNA